MGQTLSETTSDTPQKVFVDDQCNSSSLVSGAEHEVIDEDSFLFHLDMILIKAEEFCFSSWNIDLKIHKIIRNPFLLSGNATVVKKFMNALNESRLNLFDIEESNYHLGWHGTEEYNIDSICRNGFDPNLRKGQQYGVGEYFGVSATAR